MHNCFYYTIFQAKREWKTGDYFQDNLRINIRLFTSIYLPVILCKSYKHHIHRFYTFLLTAPVKRGLTSKKGLASKKGLVSKKGLASLL